MAGYVYVLRCGPFYKIGITHNVLRRLSELRTLPPFDIELYHVFESDDPTWTERFLHRTFRDHRKNGEWFSLSDAEAAWVGYIVAEADHAFCIGIGYTYAAWEIGAEAVRLRLPKTANPFVPDTVCWRSWNEAHHDMSIAGPVEYLWRDPYPEDFDRMRQADNAEVDHG